MAVNTCTIISVVQRVDAAKARIESLNPLVHVESIATQPEILGDGLDALIASVDLVCVTDSDRDNLVSCATFHVSVQCLNNQLEQIRINAVCRRLGKPFYAGGSYGFLGYIFCDLLKHDYIAP